jgi:hypothetical protein
MRITLFFISVFVFSSCLKEESPVSKRNAGDIITNEVNLTNSYQYQLYFDLSTNKMVSKNVKTIWDIAFHNGSDKNVILNGAKIMEVYSTNTTQMSAILDTVGLTLNPNFDMPSGRLDSTAIGDWQDGLVRIVNLGISPDGTPQGIYKIKITTATADSYTFIYAPLSSTDFTELTITTDSDHSFTYFNLRENKVVEVAPIKTDWDIQFTEYTHIFYQPYYTSYLVVGCLTNHYNTKSIALYDVDFDNIDIEMASSLDLSSDINNIGYDWKTFDGNQYTVDPTITYVIQDSEGYFYKLRFISYYSPNGAKGNPVFEFQQL